VCDVITPESVGHHHVSDPLEVAELLRETLAEELRSMNDIQARWHMIEDDKVKHALEHILGDKRRLLVALWGLLSEVETRAWSDAGERHA
jgi:hypothetical protein